jgi:hypothetical protein
LNNPLPSPLNADADIDADTFNEPLICVFAFICNGELPIVPISKVCTAEPLNFPTTLTDSDVAVKIDEPLTKSDTLLILF